MGKRKAKRTNKRKEQASGEAVQGAAPKRPRRGPRKPRTHPLTVPTVIRNIFSYDTSLEAVMRNRMVCKAWHTECQGPWDKLVIGLRLLRRTPTAEEQAVSLAAQYQAVSNARNQTLQQIVPYNKFTLLEWTFDTLRQAVLRARDNGEEVETTTEVDAFEVGLDRWVWNVLGTQLMTDVTFYGCSFTTELTCFRAHFLKAVPLLRKLSVVDCEITLEAAEEGHKAFIRELISDEPISRHAHANLNAILVKLTPTSAHPPLVAALVQCLEMTTKKDISVKLRGFDMKLQSIFIQLLYHAGLTSRGRLHTLDMLDFDGQAEEYGPIARCGGLASVLTQLRVLNYDIGYVGGAAFDMFAVSSRLPALRTLSIYRAPLEEPTTRLFENCNSRSLQEVYFYGNVTGNMEFLWILVNLEKVVMRTSGYEDRYHGARILGALPQLPNRQKFPLINKCLFDTTQMTYPARKFVLPLRHLEIDWNIRLDVSWTLFGFYTQNLAVLKCKIMNLSQLRNIRKQWSRLEEIEMLHGSALIPDGLVIHQVLRSFPKLRQLTWTLCHCNEHKLKKEQVEENSVAQELAETGVRVTRKVIAPWDRADTENGDWQGRTRIGGKFCIRHEYEQCLLKGDFSNYPDLLRLQPPSPF